MPKKRTSRKTHRTTHSRTHGLETEIVKNLVELQKVHTNLAEKFDKLATEISQLLTLFEVTAKTFTKNAPLGEQEKDKEFLEKIDKLLEQNKILAKGLSLMEERLRERMYGSGSPSLPPQQPEQRFVPPATRAPPRF